MARTKLFLTVALAGALGLLLGLTAALTNARPYRGLERLAAVYGRYNPADNGVYLAKAPVLAAEPADASITMLGDSLSDFGPWRALLPGADIEARGIPGDTTAGLAARLRRGEPSARTVFVMIGVNDQKNGLSLQQSEANLKDIVTMLHGKRVFLQSTLLTTVDSLNTRVRQLNAFERSLCAEAGCTFIDLNRSVSDGTTLRPHLTIDGVHLNWAGYSAWAAAIRPLLAALPDRPTSD